MISSDNQNKDSLLVNSTSSNQKVANSETLNRGEIKKV